MFAPLLLGFIALYLLIGWALLWLVARDELERQRAPRQFVASVLLWPATVLMALARRGRREPPR